MTDQLPDPVVLAYVHDTEYEGSFFDSHRRLVAHDLMNNQRMIRAGEIGARYGTGGIVSARNKAVTEYLRSDVPWLCWIDTDMGYPENLLDVLAESADPIARPVMGGLCFAWREIEPDGLGGFHQFPIPTIYDWHINPDGSRGFMPRREYERDTVIEVSGTGSACLLIHRSVFEKIAAAPGYCTCPEVMVPGACPGHWYDQLTIIETGASLSEDLSFCTRVVQAGFPIHINTAVKTTHAKKIYVSELHYDMFRKALGSDSLVELQAVGYRPESAVLPSGEVVKVRQHDMLEQPAPPANRAERRAKRRQRVKS